MQLRCRGRSLRLLSWHDFSVATRCQLVVVIATFALSCRKGMGLIKQKPIGRIKLDRTWTGIARAAGRFDDYGVIRAIALSLGCYRA